MTREDWLTFFGNVEGALDDLGTGTDSVAEGFSVTRSITEVTANRMVGTLTTIAELERMTALNTARLVELMGGGMPAGSAPMPAAALAPAATSTTAAAPLAPLVVNVGSIGPFNLANASEAEAEAAGAAAGRGFIREVDRGLGDRSLDYRRARGLH
jgi:hypothetical protein